MSKLLGVDFETNGPEPLTCDITEAAWVLFDTEFPAKPVVARTFLNADVTNMDPKAQEITGITIDMCKAYGVSRDFIKLSLFEDIERYKPDYLIAHNARGFDKIIFERLMPEAMHNYAWIDTMEDFEEKTYEVWGTRTLEYMAAKNGFLNPFPHAALFDVMTMMKIFAMQPMERVIVRSKMSTVTVAAEVSFHDKDLAKERKYMWENIRGKIYPKKWVKRMKLEDVEIERKNCPFKIAVIA